MAISQTTKQLIDIGEIGNASTGDILYDGGDKINSVFNQVYNAFGDKRLAVGSGNGDGVQTLYGTGYFQHPTSSDFASAISNGTQWDIDTSSGSVTVRLSKGKQGEIVRFCNSNGSLSVSNYLSIVPNDSFKRVNGNLNITAPYSIVTCVCISDSNGISIWDYSIESMFGSTVSTINKTAELGTVTTSIPICHKSEYNVVKLMMTVNNSNMAKMKTSEVVIMIDSVNNKLYTTEYASIIVGATDKEDEEIYKCEFSINATTGFVNATVSSSTAGMRLAIKSIETQKIEVAS